MEALHTILILSLTFEVLVAMVYLGLAQLQLANVQAVAGHGEHLAAVPQRAVVGV